eukprot:jgi/Antlo1/2503/167
MYFLGLLPHVESLNINNENLARVCNVTKNLHKRTKFRTLYELFSVAEKTSIPEIQKKYRRMMREEKFADGTPIGSSVIGIVNESYDVLRRCKDTYDYLLDHPYLMREPVSLSKINIIVGVLIAIATLLVADFLGAAVRILLYNRKKTQKKSTKKERRECTRTPSLNDMNMLKLYRILVRKKH